MPTTPLSPLGVDGIELVSFRRARDSDVAAGRDRVGASLGHLLHARAHRIGIGDR